MTGGMAAGDVGERKGPHVKSCGKGWCKGGEGGARMGKNSCNGPLVSAPKTMGVMRPASVETATEISATLCWRMNVSNHDELAWR